jgi:glutathione peroxidase
MTENFYSFKAKNLKNEEISLSDYKEKTLLIVNIASKCGFTPQLKGLEELYKKYKDKDFIILAFPCNQFANQEPGDNEAIYQICYINYGVSFPVFAKIKVNGKEAHPLYKYLKRKKSSKIGSRINWNFTKFLVNKNGETIKRFEPNINPEKIDKYIKKNNICP